MHTLQDLFFNELADCYDAECRTVKALPAMAKASVHGELKGVLELHLAETEGHVRKIGLVFGCFDRKPRWKTCETIMGLLREGQDMAAAFAGSPAIHAALVVSIQRVRHYKMASYGSLHDWALQLGNKKAAALLNEILKEQTATYKLLATLARTIRHEEIVTKTGVAGVSRI